MDRCRDAINNSTADGVDSVVSQAIQMFPHLRVDVATAANDDVLELPCDHDGAVGKSTVIAGIEPAVADQTRSGLGVVVVARSRTNDLSCRSFAPRSMPSRPIRLSLRAANLGVQLHGGAGYMDE